MKTIATFFALLAFQFIAILTAKADTPVQYTFNGDPSSVTAQAETDKYCWIGTKDGLYLIRKKGHKVFHMTSKNSLLPSDHITSIAVNANGEAYIGTNEGILRYDNYTFLLIDKENSALKSNYITSLACLNGTDIYAGTLDKGITVFSGLSSKTFTADNSLITDNHVLSIEQKGNNSLLAILENDQRVCIRNKQFLTLDSE